MKKLYDYPKSGNGYKARLLLAHLNQPYDYIPLDILRGETQTTEFLQKNLNGRVPLLELEDGTFLPESNAILYFLAQDSKYWPDSVLEQAQVLQWMFFEQYSHEPNIATARFWLSIKGLENTPLNQELFAQKQKQGHQALTVMETHLKNHTFFVGDAYTIADIALYAYTHVAEEGGFRLSGYPRICAWLNRVRGQPEHITIEQWSAG